MNIIKNTIDKTIASRNTVLEDANVKDIEDYINRVDGNTELYKVLKEYTCNENTSKLLNLLILLCLSTLREIGRN